MMFLQSEIYLLGGKGSMSCPSGTVLVTDEHECRESAAVFGKPFESIGCYRTDVAGCFDNGPNIFLSNCPTGFTALTHAAVCKRKHNI